MGRPFSPLKFPHRRSEPPSNTWFLGPAPVFNLSGISIGLAVFAQLTAERPYTMDYPFTIKILPSHTEIWTPIIP